MKAEPRDLLSDLPDDILLHIFSFLQVKDILSLRILSTRFNKTLCTATPTFCCSDHYLHPHNCSCTHIFDFMFNTVPKNRPRALIINRVSFSCFCNKPEHRNLHKQWIIQLFKAFHVDELSLDYDLPSIFTSLPKFQSLKVLKLNMYQLHLVNMLPQMKLAALETHHIKSIYNLNRLLGEWISQSFPFLKHLFLQKIIIWAVKPDFTIQSSSLVDLVIHDLRCPIPVRIIVQNLRTLNCFIRERVHEYKTKFVLESCVPNLQSLTWVGRRVGGDLETLKILQVTTNPRFLIMRESKWDVLIQLFQAIRSARQLHIDTDVLRQWIRILRIIMGILEDSVSLKNLSRLEIDVVGYINGKDFINYFLERLPNYLETLTLINYPNFYLKKESFEENFKGALAYCSTDGLRRTKGLKKVKLIIKEFNYNIVILLGLMMKSCTELEEIMLHYPSSYKQVYDDSGVPIFAAF